MKPSFVLLGALALALVPGALLLPGCGGGGGNSSVPNLRFSRQFSVDFPTFPNLRGVLSVNTEDTASANARAAGTLRIFANPNPPEPQPNANYEVGFAPGTYVLTGNLNGTVQTGYDLDLRGSYPDGPPFKLTGALEEGSEILIDAPFKSGRSLLRGRLSELTVTPRPVATTVGTPVATTIGGTPTPIATGTPLGNPTPIATGTPIGGGTPIPTATAVSPTPVGAGGGTTDPPRVP